MPQKYCSWCKNHGYNRSQKNHDCALKECVCNRCQVTTEVITLTQLQWDLWKEMEKDLPEESQNSLSLCERCRNHKERNLKKDHKDCPHRKCDCANCRLSENLKLALKHLAQIRLVTKVEIEKNEEMEKEEERKREQHLLDEMEFQKRKEKLDYVEDPSVDFRTRRWDIIDETKERSMVAKLVPDHRSKPSVVVASCNDIIKALKEKKTNPNTIPVQNSAVNKSKNAYNRNTNRQNNATDSHQGATTASSNAGSQWNGTSQNYDMKGYGGSNYQQNANYYNSSTYPSYGDYQGYWANWANIGGGKDMNYDYGSNYAAYPGYQGMWNTSNTSDQNASKSQNGAQLNNMYSVPPPATENKSSTNKMVHSSVHSAYHPYSYPGATTNSKSQSSTPASAPLPPTAPPSAPLPPSAPPCAPLPPTAPPIKTTKSDSKETKPAAAANPYDMSAYYGGYYPTDPSMYGGYDYQQYYASQGYYTTGYQSSVGTSTSNKG